MSLRAVLSHTGGMVLGTLSPDNAQLLQGLVLGVVEERMRGLRALR